MISPYESCLRQRLPEPLPEAQLPEGASRLAGGTIGVDRSSLKIWGMGHTGYSVNLTGRAGAWWVASFRKIEAQLGVPWRFYVDAKHAVVAFGCDRELTAKALDRLEEIVDATNREVALVAGDIPVLSAHEAEGSGPGTRRDG